MLAPFPAPAFMMKPRNARLLLSFSLFGLLSACGGENVKPVLLPQEQRRTQEATQRQRELDASAERVRQLAQLQKLIGKEIA